MMMMMMMMMMMVIIDENDENDDDDDDDSDGQVGRGRISLPGWQFAQHRPQPAPRLRQGQRRG
jgi:hypothetical protein